MKGITRFWHCFLFILFILAVFLTVLMMFMGKLSKLESIPHMRPENKGFLGEAAELERIDSKNKSNRPGIGRLNSIHSTETKSEVNYDGIRIEAPVLIKQVDPEYPKSAQKKRLQGEVVFEAEINEEGRIKTAKLLKSIHPIFIYPSLKAIRQWIYHPMLLNGQPCECLATITCNFRLAKVSKKIPVIAWRGIF